MMRRFLVVPRRGDWQETLRREIARGTSGPNARQIMAWIVNLADQMEQECRGGNFLVLRFPDSS
jgi:hypothetical protein